MKVGAPKVQGSVARRPDPVLRELVERARTELGPDPAAQETLAWAAATFGARLVVASSMSDAILGHLAAEALPGVDVLFLDTGLHFAETLAYRDRIARLLPITLLNAVPRLTVDEQDARYGPGLASSQPELCCRLRKVDVMDRVLTTYEAWVAGLRRADSPQRVSTPVVDWDARRGLVKINPIAAWSDTQVAEYAEVHGLPFNPLSADGYLSIGCRPCTRPVSEGEGVRGGRWSGHDKTECGIHGGPDAAQA